MAANTRAWHKDECDTWLGNRPKADPPDIKQRPVPKVAAEGNGPKANVNKHPLNSESSPACQALPNGRAGA